MQFCRVIQQKLIRELEACFFLSYMTTTKWLLDHRPEDLILVIFQVGQLKKHSTKLTFSTDQDLIESLCSFGKLCSNCLSAVKRGVTHDCSEATKFENLKKIIATDSRTAEKIVFFVITQKLSSPQSIIRLSSKSGKALTIPPSRS